MKSRIRKFYLGVLSVVMALGLSGCVEDVRGAGGNPPGFPEEVRGFASGQEASPEDIPAYSGEVYVVINDNVPYFTEDDFTEVSFESYSPLDDLGRCGPAFANVGQDTMPTQERGSIGQIRPSGWHTVKYDVVDGNYLYNRCHLIGYQLTAENSNELNLITGTRHFNVAGMLPFEDITADYVRETGNHVLYRVTPLFEGEDSLAKGVLMEARSVEDGGEGVCFNVFVYNVQPGVGIDYATGESWLEEGTAEEDTAGEVTDYILNTNTGKFHVPSCPGVEQMAEKNKQEYTGGREEVIAMGYEPCKNCRP